MDFRPLDRMGDSDDAILEVPYRPFYNPFKISPVLVKQGNEYERAVFKERPLLGVLLFDNVSSDARDHAANERTFLSWLKLSVYMAIVAVAIVLSFHLKTKPSALEHRVALPLGLIFWILSLACLVSGLSNYINTVTRYSKRRALVQSGWKTQVVFTVVSTAIVAACVLFLSINADKE
ncbi:similar to DUF domain-containing protein [Plenodomus lingam JN3]|uniref:Similar to DUF domain-containing protein n=1 Tax=Leptosphaeria maculans (strain JN3 / isolate v23.1.3 / race Av1-4-5-6-7-8) TaxID=985895 RepID=E4ZLV2_LEPMJ|nr:similar to DUF domain-containing protein [Plenodomus lingam JN3]CBX92782.1 similar to DUF domain-containing protein [Plenodomus lingam JN3]